MYRVYSGLSTTLIKASNIGVLIARIARWIYTIQVIALVPMFMVSGQSFSLSLITSAPIRGLIFAIAIEKLLPKATARICNSISLQSRKKPI